MAGQSEQLALVLDGEEPPGEDGDGEADADAEADAGG